MLITAYLELYLFIVVVTVCKSILTTSRSSLSSSWPSSMAMNCSSLLIDIFGWEKVMRLVGNKFENSAEIRMRLDSWDNR